VSRTTYTAPSFKSFRSEFSFYRANMRTCTHAHTSTHTYIVTKWSQYPRRPTTSWARMNTCRTYVVYLGSYGRYIRYIRLMHMWTNYDIPIAQNCTNPRSKNDCNSCFQADAAFHCEMLCKDAVLAVGRCLSVRPSVTIVYCIKTAEVIIILFFDLVTHHSSFLRPSGVTEFQGNPVSWALNTRSWKKLAIFEQYLAVSWKRYKIGTCLLWNVNRKS